MELGESHIDGTNNVQDLINGDSRTWREEFIKSHFNDVIASKILQIHLSKDDPFKEDKLI